MKRKISPYQTDDLILRLLEKDDLDHTLSWRNHESHRNWFVSTAIIPKETHIVWFHKYIELDNDFIFIVSNESNNRCGQLSIYDIDWQNKTAKFGRFLVNPLLANSGIMKAACRMGVNLAKEILHLSLLTLEVKQIALLHQ